MAFIQLAAQILVVFFIIRGVSANCQPGCDDLTELCVEVGGGPQCQCRPSLYDVSGKCVDTKSYSTDVRLTDAFEWVDDLADQNSGVSGNFSELLCEEFDSAIISDETLGPSYYGCEVVAFYLPVSPSVATSDGLGAIVLSFFNTTLGGNISTDLEATLKTNLDQEFFDTSTIETLPSDECTLGIHDCDDESFDTCSDAGAGGFNCSCHPYEEDKSPAGLPGRICAPIKTEPELWIIYTSLGTSLLLCIVLLAIVACLSIRFSGGVSRPLDDKDSALGDELPIYGLANNAYDASNVEDIPDATSGIDEGQLARLTQLQLAIERASQPVSQPMLPRATAVTTSIPLLEIVPSQQQQRNLSAGSDQVVQVSGSVFTFPEPYDQGPLHSESNHSRQSSTVFVPASPNPYFIRDGNEQRHDAF